MHLLHISDPHFTAEKYNVEPHKALEGLVELINKKSEGEDLFVLLTGDITSKGNKKGFEKATDFFKSLFERLKINSKNFIVCPGNHDCNTEKISFGNHYINFYPPVSGTDYNRNLLQNYTDDTYFVALHNTQNLLIHNIPSYHWDISP